MKIGVIGGGQLGRMLALAGYPLGFEFAFLDPAPDAPARTLGAFTQASFSDVAAIVRFASEVDVLTYEFENIAVEVLEALRATPVYPPIEALRVGQARLNEKIFFNDLGIETARNAKIESLLELTARLQEFGGSAILKTNRYGYDGKGQYLLRNAAEAELAWREVQGSSLILEERITFQRELSILSVRSTRGEIAFYPLTENVHRGGILRRSIAPAANLTDALTTQAQTIARAVLEKLDYVGVLAIELFEREGTLLANEMAPRVHNSGHWTIDGAETSQFENHLRAIAGLTLGSTAARGYAAMLNLIGSMPSAAELTALSGAHLHIYGKEPRPDRKIGHLNFCATEHSVLMDQLRRAEAFLHP